MFIMNTLNKKKLINHISDVIKSYKQRRDSNEIAGELQVVADYNIRILPLTNLQIRIMRGDFDEPIDKNEVPDIIINEKNGVELNEN